MLNGVYYRVIVLKDNVHFFATNTSDFQYTNIQIRDIKAAFVEKFPATEGYTITIDSIRATPNIDSLTGTVPN